MTAALESGPEPRAGSAADGFSMSHNVGSVPASLAITAFVATDTRWSRDLYALDRSPAWVLPCGLQRDFGVNQPDRLELP
jgi:hypothetical protein